jgi:GT2 family glycosyltransferase
VGTARFRFATRPQEVDTVYLGAWPRIVFEQVGGFDETLVRNQDYEFNYRLRQAGGTVLYSPDLRVTYYGRPTLRKLWQQYFDYGFWKARVIALHPRSTRPRHLVAPLFVLGLVAGVMLSLVGEVWRWLYVAALLTYALLTFVFSVAQAARHGWRTLTLLPLVFLTLHLAWGMGFWTGVVHWWSRRSIHKEGKRGPRGG